MRNREIKMRFSGRITHDVASTEKRSMIYADVSAETVELYRVVDSEGTETHLNITNVAVYHSS